MGFRCSLGRLRFFFTPPLKGGKNQSDCFSRFYTPLAPLKEGNTMVLMILFGSFLHCPKKSISGLFAEKIVNGELFGFFFTTALKGGKNQSDYSSRFYTPLAPLKEGNTIVKKFKITFHQNFTFNYCFVFIKTYTIF